MTAGRLAKKGSPLVEKARLAVLGLARWQLAGLVGSLTAELWAHDGARRRSTLRCSDSSSTPLALHARQKALREHLESVSMP